MIDKFWKGTQSIGNRNSNGQMHSTLFECDHNDPGVKRRLFYMIKPFIPKPLQIAMRRLKARGLRWDYGDGIETLCFERLKTVVENQQRSFHSIWFWPRGFETASIITHDIETQNGLQQAIRLAEVDQKYGFRSAFNFVPERYQLDHGIMKELRSRGFEIGVHGLKHDGKLFDSKSIFDKRSVMIAEYARKWNAIGFRSPALLHNLEWLGSLGFEWDSSCADYDPFGPQPGGCRTIFPFFISMETVELPVTLMQDHTLFEILGRRDIAPWTAKLNYIRSRCGLVNIIVHPDYIFTSGRLRLYESYLECLSGSSKMWHCLPKEVAQWWKVREQSKIESNKGDSPHLTGPAIQQGIFVSYDTLKERFEKQLVRF